MSTVSGLAGLWPSMAAVILLTNSPSRNTSNEVKSEGGTDNYYHDACRWNPLVMSPASGPGPDV